MPGGNIVASAAQVLQNWPAATNFRRATPKRAIALLRDFTIVGEVGQRWSTGWIRFPSTFQNAQYVVNVKSILVSTSSADIDLVTAYEFAPDSGVVLSSPGPFVGPGLSTFNVASGLGKFVRLAITIQGSPTHMVVSVWLTPKKN